MKYLILESKWLGSGRAVSIGEVREDLSDDEAKLLRTMNAATADKAMVALAEEKQAAERNREKAARRPIVERAAAPV